MSNGHDWRHSMVGRSAAAALKASSSDHFLIICLLAVGTAIGILFVKDYGVSWDEPYEAIMGSEALRVYSGSQEYFALEALPEHGPAYYMLFVASSRAIHSLIPALSLIDGRHITNFLAFLVGLGFFYAFCLRFMQRLSAFLATLLFATQPLFFGSSFINQKDIPLMAFFLGVATLGLAAVADRSAREDTEPAPASAGRGGVIRGFMKALELEWKRLGQERRRRILTMFAVGLILAADLLYFGLIRRVGESFVVAAYGGRAPWPLQPIFNLIATDAYKTPLRLYLERYGDLFQAGRLATIGLLVIVGMATLSRQLPSIARLLGSTAPGVRIFPLLASSVLLGGSMAIRQIAFFAGILVTFYLLFRCRIRSVIPLILYWTIAGSVTFVTWPYLWPDPVQRVTDSFLVMQEFGLHMVLFQGHLLPASSLPWNYFPTLVGLELTEPALIFTLLGGIILAWRSLRTKASLLDAAIIAMWIGLPVYWLISRDVPIYNNTRHLFFIFPPILTLAGIGFEVAYAAVKRLWARAALVTFTFLPGILAIVLLHPYEYTYFNSLAGGTGAAYGVYDQEYWCTSIKEATDVVNRMARVADHYMVFGPIQNAVPYARSDLILESQYSPLEKADIATVCKYAQRSNWDPSGFRLVYEVKRGRAVFAEVWVRMIESGS